MLNYKEILSEVQYKAASSYQGACLVIAGAGSGKTRVLTYRIAYMIEHGIEPYNILSLTFTNKAAEEMRERITGVVSQDKSRNIWMGTFHSIFGRILRREAAAIGFTDSYTIYEPNDCKNLIKSIVKEMNLDEKKYDPKFIYKAISLAKNGLLTPQIYCSNQARIADDIKQGMGEFCNVYRNYMLRCKQNNVMDFDDLLLYTNILFKKNPEILAKYQKQFKYILVDEYQDTNSAQYLIVKKLAEGAGNICVVGDDAQSIYSFRGAKIENILRFKKDYPDSLIITLEENYRSTQTIVNAANCIISKNTEQLKKNVFSKKDVGEKVALRRAYTDKQEAGEIRSIISAENGNGVQYRDFAILYRTNAQSKVLEDQLRLYQIPYKIHKGFSFYQHAEIKNILAYVRLISNSSDSEALKRIINFPARGIGATSLEKIGAFAREKEVSMWDAITKFPIEQMGINGGTAKKIYAFTELIGKYKEQSQSEDAFNILYSMLGDSGILALYRDSKDPEKESAYQNIEELVNSLKQQCELYLKQQGEALKISEWIQEVLLLTSEERVEGEDVDNKVTLMTIHSAKGLEFDTVFIAGVEEGMFPGPMAAESLSDLEEERRLFYVAATRAVRKLVISYSLSRYKWGSLTNTTPSRFIAEIDAQYYDCPDLMSSKGAYDDDNDFLKNIVGGEYQNKTKTVKQTAYRGNTKIDYNSKPSFQSQPRRPIEEPRPKPTNLVRANMKRVAVRSTESVNVTTQNGLDIGDRVRHERFGAGAIKSMEQTATDTRVCVEFDETGEKTLLMKFAKLRKI